MKKPLRILHLETGMNLYGGALQVLYLIRGLAASGEVQHSLVCPEGSAIAEAARDHVESVITVPMRGDLDLPFIGRLAGVIKNNRPDIMHLHSRRGADVLGGIAARLSGTPAILTRRVDNPENRAWAKVKYSLYDHVITISEGIRDVLVGEGIPTGKITCVHSAVDAAFYNRTCDRDWFLTEFGLKEDQRFCGTVAQFIGRKGHRFLLTAVPQILKAVPSAVFLFFGKGPLEGSLRLRCRELGIEKQVLFAGFRDDMHRIFGCLDLVIHPALMEGLGVSLLQAAAAGVPIVGADTGGIPEIVRDTVNGYIVPPGDAPAIVSAVVRILGDPGRGRMMGENGRQLVKELFSIEAMVEGNMMVYREMMKKFRDT